MNKYRTHRNEMIRFANSKDGTEVWCKHHTAFKWLKTKMPHKGIEDEKKF